MSCASFGVRKRVAAYVPRTRVLDDALLESFERRAYRARRGGDLELARAYGAARLFDHGRNSLNADGTIQYITDTIKVLALDTAGFGPWLKQVTNATNANPVVYTAASNGFANNDVVCVGSVGGNLSANQTGLVASVATNTFQLTTLLGGAAVAGSAAFTTNGFALNLTQAVFVGDILGTRVSSDQTLAGKTSSRGISNATSPISWGVVAAGNTVTAFVLFNAVGDDGANRLLAWQDGRCIVRLTSAALAGDVTLRVDPLPAALWDGTTGAAPVLSWSDGHSSTLNAAANQGDITLTITAQAAGGIAAGSQAEGVDFGGGLPFVTSGTTLQFAIGTIEYPTIPTGLYVP